MCRPLPLPLPYRHRSHALRLCVSHMLLAHVVAHSLQTYELHTVFSRSTVIIYYSQHSLCRSTLSPTGHRTTRTLSTLPNNSTHFPSNSPRLVHVTSQPSSSSTIYWSFSTSLPQHASTAKEETSLTSSAPCSTVETLSPSWASCLITPLATHASSSTVPRHQLAP